MTMFQLNIEDDSTLDPSDFNLRVTDDGTVTIHYKDGTLPRVGITSAYGALRLTAYETDSDGCFVSYQTMSVHHGGTIETETVNV